MMMTNGPNFSREISRPTTRRQVLRPLVIIGLLVGLATAAQASDLKVGVHGLAWASHVRDHGHLIRVRAAGPVSYYVNRYMTYQAANQPVPGWSTAIPMIASLRSTSSCDRLFAVYIQLRSPDQA